MPEPREGRDWSERMYDEPHHDAPVILYIDPEYQLIRRNPFIRFIAIVGLTAAVVSWVCIAILAVFVVVALFIG